MELFAIIFGFGALFALAYWFIEIHTPRKQAKKAAASGRVRHLPPRPLPPPASMRAAARPTQAERDHADRAFAARVSGAPVPVYTVLPPALSTDPWPFMSSAFADSPSPEAVTYAAGGGGDFGGGGATGSWDGGSSDSSSSSDSGSSSSSSD